MTEADIQHCIVRTLFTYRRCVCVPNVDWGFLPWEADLVVLHASGYADEIEIKISVSDLRRDKNKAHHHTREILPKGQRIRSRYYAAPEAVLARIRAGDVPADAGIIAVAEVNGRLRAEVTRKAKAFAHARKLTPEEKYKLARLGCLRYWSQVLRT